MLAAQSRPMLPEREGVMSERVLQVSRRHACLRSVNVAGHDHAFMGAYRRATFTRGRDETKRAAQQMFLKAWGKSGPEAWAVHAMPVIRRANLQ